MPKRRMPFHSFVLALLLHASGTHAAESYLLQPTINPGEVSQVVLELRLAGQLVVEDEQGALQRLPLQADAKLAYAECLTRWSLDPQQPARSLRRYDEALLAWEAPEGNAPRKLPRDKELIVAQVGGGALLVNRLDDSLTHEEMELLTTIADPLTVDRLLPGMEVAVGESWKHTPESLAGLLGLDRVVETTATSEVTGIAERQVQIRLRGDVQGEVEGAKTRLQLEGAYLFDLDRGRINKFHLALEEHRAAGAAAPGLEATARVELLVGPGEEGLFAPDETARAAAKDEVELRHVLFEAPAQGYRFLRDRSWVVTSRQRELASLRLLQEGRLLAHCNLANLPAPAAKGGPTLEKLERDIRSTLGEKVQKITVAREWQSSLGNRVLGIFAEGAIEETPMQWRYYLVERAGLPMVSVSVTVEQSRLADFADADRLIIDSLELSRPSGIPTAQRSGPRGTR
jgi:hypothetical protein